MSTDLNFSQLPLKSVVLKIAPDEYIPSHSFLLQNMIFRHFRKDYPFGRHISEAVPGIGRACLEIYSPTQLGIELRSSDDSMRLVLQSNLLAVEWSNPRFDSSLQYPGYKSIRSQMQRILTLLSKIKRLSKVEGPLTYRATNLCYTNCIVTKSHPSVSNVLDYIQGSVLPARLSPGDVIHEQNVCWKQPDGADLRIRVQETTTYDNSYCYELSCTCGQVIEPTASPLQNLNTNHDLLIKLFPELITERAKGEWGYSSGRNEDQDAQLL
jgi:uncharacterized protein (TIGR04255 family)